MILKFCFSFKHFSFAIMSSQYAIIIILSFVIGATVSNPLQSRILSGNNALPGQFPWMVSLRRTSGSSHFCGGSLVTPRHVVTAAHCVMGFRAQPETIFVVSGHVNNWEGGRNTAVSEVRVHPDFQSIAHDLGLDIAVLKLATPVPFNAFELPIPIATKEPGIYPCVLSGWGMTLFPSSSAPAQLQTIILRSMSRQTCLESWDEDTISNSVLCAGGILTEGGCFGDSGSPLVCNGELSGVVATGDACANGRPDLYAKVFYHRDWLLETTADVMD